MKRLPESMLQIAAILSLFLGPCGRGASDSGEETPWTRPRDMQDFQGLLDHTPFALPTAEVSSPLSERYAMTGMITIGSEEEIFVFDRSDQSRTLVTRKPNEKNISLVALVPASGDAPAKATIRVGSEQGTIGFLESVQPKTAAQSPSPGAPATVVQGQVIQPLEPQQTAQPPPATRKVIYRSAVTPPQP